MSKKIIALGLDEIKVGKRLRKDVDLTLLKISMKELGLLQPILVDKDFKLISGYRRLMVANELGWEAIDAIMLDMDDPKERLVMEMDENITRLDLNAFELEDGYNRLRMHNKDGFFWKVVSWIFG